MIPALPDRADRVNHILSLELATCSRNCLTRRNWTTLGTQLATFVRNRRTAGAMNCPANASAGQQFGVGSIHDDIKG